MVNATPFGIYRKIFLTSCGILFFFLSFAQQDFLIYEDGTKQEIFVEKWHADKFVSNNQVFKADAVQSVFRSQAGVTYKPLAVIFTKKPESIPNVFVPSIESLKKIQSDYYTDEYLEVWMQKGFFIYLLKNIVITNAENNLENYNQNPIFLYHDALGFTQVSGSEIDEEFFKLSLSRYFKDYKLRDYIYDYENKVISKDFLKFFDEMISLRTEINYKDEHLKWYYAKQLRKGALIVLLNTSSKQAKMYQEAGNVKVANKIEERLKKDNAKIVADFNDTDMYNFSAVYFTEATNREAILDGETKYMFFNSELKLDSSIVLEEDFVLFTRKGTVYETRLLDNNILSKRIPNSTPLMQDVQVLFNCNNIQFVEPYIIMQRNKTASTFNNYFYKQLQKLRNHEHEENMDYQWNFSHFWFNNKWLSFTDYKPCTIID